MRREASPSRTLTRSRHNTSGAYHEQHVACHEVRRDSSAINFDTTEISIIFAFYFTGRHPQLDEGLTEADGLRLGPRLSGGLVHGAGVAVEESRSILVEALRTQRAVVHRVVVELARGTHPWHRATLLLQPLFCYNNSSVTTALLLQQLFCYNRSSATILLQQLSTTLLLQLFF